MAESSRGTAALRFVKKPTVVVRSTLESASWVIASAGITRVGAISPASLLASDPMLLRYFVESFLMEKHEAVDVLEKSRTERHVCGALEDIAAAAGGSDEGRDAIVQSGKIDAVLLAMADYPASAPVQERGCRALYCIAECPEYVGSIGRRGGIRAVLSAIVTNKSCAPVLTAACAAIERLASDEETKVSVAESGGIEAIVSSMVGHPSESLLQEHSCGALWALTQGTRSFDKRVLECGGAPAIVTALIAQVGHSGVCEYALGAIASIASRNGNHTKVAECGGVEVITAAMLANPFDAAVQENGGWALWSLARSDDAKAKIATHGGAKAAVTALRIHFSNPKVVTGCLAALAAAGANAAVNSEVIAHGGIEAAIAAMRASPEMKEIQSSGIAVVSMAIVALDYVERLSMTSGSELLRGAIARHCTVTGEMGFFAVGGLILQNENVARVLSAGGVDVLLGAMKRHPSDSALLRLCCASVLVVSLVKEGRLQLLRSGAPDVIIAILHRFPQVVEIQLRGCVTLAMLAVEDRKVIESFPLVEAIVSSMFTLADNNTFQVCGVCCLAYVAQYLGFPAKCVDAGGLRALASFISSGRATDCTVAFTCAWTLIATQELFGKCVTDDIVEIFRRESMAHPECTHARHLLGAVTRTVDPSVDMAIREGVCSLVHAPTCPNSGNASVHGYCPQCSTVQRLFVCSTCSSPSPRAMKYCEVCFRMHHAGHTGVEFFEPGSCCCELSSCKCGESSKVCCGFYIIAQRFHTHAATNSTHWRRQRCRLQSV